MCQVVSFVRYCQVAGGVRWCQMGNKCQMVIGNVRLAAGVR